MNTHRHLTGPCATRTSRSAGRGPRPSASCRRAPGTRTPSHGAGRCARLAERDVTCIGPSGSCGVSLRVPAWWCASGWRCRRSTWSASSRSRTIWRSSSGPCRRCPARLRSSSRHAPWRRAPWTCRCLTCSRSAKVRGRLRNGCWSSTHRKSDSSGSTRGEACGTCATRRTAWSKPDGSTGLWKDRETAKPPRRCTGGGSGPPPRKRTPRPAPRSPRSGAGFEACWTRYVLHADVDVMVGRRERGHDYLADMLAPIAGDPKALTVAFNIAMDHDRPYTGSGASGAWRVEVPRAGMIDRVRLRDACPLPNRLDGDCLALPWGRALDHAAAQGNGRSLRGGDRRTFYVHPPNARKGDTSQWLVVLDGIEHGVAPRVSISLSIQCPCTSASSQSRNAATLL